MHVHFVVAKSITVSDKLQGTIFDQPNSTLRMICHFRAGIGRIG
jgi:hypothetical protein